MRSISVSRSTHDRLKRFCDERGVAVGGLVDRLVRGVLSDPDYAIDRVPRGPVVRPAATAGLATCPLCERGIPRSLGVHVPSQRAGMIQPAPCSRVFATNVERVEETYLNRRPWVAYVDGDVLRVAGGKQARRFATPERAYREACRAACRADK